MSRWKAASIHLAISALIITSIVGLVLWLWYPPALLKMSGLDHLILVIAGIDLVAGPLLTLLVFKAGKPSLRFDLSVIAAIQFALLAYGLYTLAQARPVFVVGVVDRFEVVTASQVAEADLQSAKPPFNRLPWTGPMQVGARIPDDSAQQERILARAMAGQDIHVMPQFYVPYDAIKAALAGRASPVSSLLGKANEAEKATLRRAAGETALETLSYLPIEGAKGSATMLFDANTQNVVRPAAVDPWAIAERKD